MGKSKVHYQIFTLSPVKHALFYITLTQISIRDGVGGALKQTRPASDASRNTPSLPEDPDSVWLRLFEFSRLLSFPTGLWPIFFPYDRHYMFKEKLCWEALKDTDKFKTFTNFCLLMPRPSSHRGWKGLYFERVVSNFWHRLLSW